ncbi:MAG: substrate-binding domain-containing protein [Bilifractor sp.]|jgi:Ca-activated chloride channel family protein
MRKKKIISLIMVFILALGLALTGCGWSGGADGGVSSSSGSGTSDRDQTFRGGSKGKLSILSGSENKELAPILEDFAKKEKVEIDMHYAGSVDIMRALQKDDIGYDAVWPASSLWITAGDTNHKIKHAESISVTPVIFGIRQSLAEELGFVGKEVKVADILEAIRSGKLKFCMTSATQSNSGCSAYIGFLYALLGNPDVIVSEDLQKEDLQNQIKEIFSGVNRSSGSSDWLKDMFLAGDYDAMVNYECLIISANQELEKENKETLYAVYPEDGLSLADSPLGYVDGGDKAGEELFLTLQEYLLSDEVQNEIQKTGRRTGFTQKVSDENQKIFNKDWGIQPDRVLSPFTMPSLDVLTEALDLYQTELRKPSLTVYCLDYSGSMSGEGNQQLVDAMSNLLDQSKAEDNLLQASPEDINIIIPFDGNTRSVITAKGNGAELEKLEQAITSEVPGGGTDIYSAASEGILEMKKYDLSRYTAAIILMTDGRSVDNRNDFEETYKESGDDIPVFSITFGDADPSQLEEIAQETNARVFDGSKDLTAAFRAAKGYN